MTFDFLKYEGAGNDFIIVDDRVQQFPAADSKLVNHLCDRHFGIGADGLILLRNLQGFDFQMVYFNSDGNESSMCGNGARCITKFAYDIGLKKDKYAFKAYDGNHEALLVSTNVVTVRMSDVDGVEENGGHYFVNTGSPHYIIFDKDLKHLNIISEAHKIRYSDRFKKEGVNVNFITTSKEGNAMRTYERGVEGETLACGTGTVAAAIAIAAKCNDTTPHQQYLINAPGGLLKVTFDRNGKEKFTNIWLEGPVHKVFGGTYTI